MARLFNDASSQYLKSDTAIITAYPFTIACWAYTDDMATQGHCVSIVDRASEGRFHRLYFASTAAGEPIRYTSNHTTTFILDTTTGHSVNTWHHLAARSSASNNHAVYLDGGGKQTSSISSTLDSTPNGAAIGALYRLTPAGYMSGRIAEVGWWNVGLTDAEIAILALGYSPLLVRPQSLVAYHQCIGRTSPEIDLVGGYDMTLNAGPTVAEHPSVIYPSSYQQGLTIAGAPPAGGIMQQLQYANLGASLYNGTLLIG